MKYVFASVFSVEMIEYISLLHKEGRYINKIQSSLRCLDRHLINCGLTEKILDAQTITSWLQTRDVCSVTKANDIYHIKGFAKYLKSLHFDAKCPEVPKAQSEYVPYMFSVVELERIFSVADNFETGKVLTRSGLIFPILLRLLYGCGLRLGEGLTLRWKDVDLESGVLTIKKAKNQKQRFVPMAVSMTLLLKMYKAMTYGDGICKDYLFESSLNLGKPFLNQSFQKWFSKVLKIANIHYIRRTKQERGPCPHCFRHIFTFKSFLKSEEEGRRFEDTAPFLSAYLGHDGSTGTEKYLTTNYSLYTQSHQRINAAIGHLFPEVSFDEE